MSRGLVLQLANVLGDVRAEADHYMLDRAFLQTPDYKTLIETADRAVVVGRRGTGKSALAYRLAEHWNNVPRTCLVQIAPEEDQIVALRHQIELFGEKFTHLRAASRIAWKYGLLVEFVVALSTHHRFAKGPDAGFFSLHLNRWKAQFGTTSSKIRRVLSAVVARDKAPAERIGDLATALDVDEIERAAARTVTFLSVSGVVLVDRVDEGYEPDAKGVGLVDGIVQASIDLNTRIPGVRVTIFLRDNMIRAIQQLDPDYSRNVEGQVLRLHWEEHQLFDLACARLRTAFKITQENNQRVWNACVGPDLKGAHGFRRCLKLTLYRPRDLIVLLNEAFLDARKNQRQQIGDYDIELTAKVISANRLEDLHKEYSAIFPGLQRFSTAFAQGPVELTVDNATSIIQDVLVMPERDAFVQQTFALFESPPAVALALYSIGFFGIHDRERDSFLFCHDGRAPERELSGHDRILIHPCYWMALNLKQEQIESHRAEEIFDEYDITVVSESPELRRGMLTVLANALSTIPLGTSGAKDFENWCLRAVRVLFVAKLTNVDLHPNKSSVLRRDVVATNVSTDGVWRRIYEDYRTRQVLFEVKNQEGLGADEYRQVLSYLTGQYGRCGFFITRDRAVELERGKECDWARELYTGHNAVAIKLTGPFLAKLLLKARNPSRFEEAESQLHKLLDDYTRLWFSQPSSSGKTRRRTKEHRPRIRRTAGN